MNKIENDALRSQIPCISKPNLLVLTRGISCLPEEEIADILMKVKNFNSFSKENDPWGEHDFGSFDHNGKKIFWKIDDYRGTEGYELILTVMFADEY